MIRAYTRAKCHDSALGMYKVMSDRGLDPDRYTFTFALKACTGSLDLEEGVSIHKKVVERKLDGDLFICTGLVDLYCKVGDLDRARRVFDQMPDRDAVSCNAMIAGLSQGPNPEDSIQLFRAMQLSGVRLNSVSCLNLFPAVSRLGEVRMCRSLHGYMVRRDLKGGVYNGLIDLYTKCGDVESARLIFDALDNRDDVSWSSMMAGYAHNGYFHEVLDLYDRMVGMDVEINKVSIVTALLAAGELRMLEKGVEIHKLATEKGVNVDVVVATPIMTMYAKCGVLQKAQELFEEISDRDVVAWSALMAAFGQSGYPEMALSLFRDMQHQAVRPNRITLASILPACAELVSPALGKSIHCYALKHDVVSDTSVGTALVSMYAKCGCSNQALTIFENMHCKDVVTWNAIINGYSQANAPFSAIGMFKKLQESGLCADAGTMVVTLTACASINDLSLGTPIHTLVIGRGFESDCHVMNALIDMYSKCGDLSSAAYLFHYADFSKDDVSWNIMIAGYMHTGEAEGALSIYYHMRSMNILPNAVTFVSVVPAATQLTAVREGMAFHASIIQMGLLSNLLVGNSLIDMYGKSGRLDLSRRCFDEMENKDTVSWNSLLAGYALHGQGSDAIALFSLMQLRHVEIDSVSYLSMLSACRHAGLIEQGRQIFNSMVESHQIKPNVEHYACMVDLLGRAGLFDETIHLIEKMPMEPDAGLWGALLGACKMHSNVKLGEFAYQKLTKLEPGNPVHFVVLSGIYARSGQWTDAGVTRSRLKDAGLRKNPGYSWL
ncbi:hypothetical protein MLD38_009775 [Melastoma candidum]|nr:hypothetical protein MLD38_009775 [Melastoma candidum]